MHLVGAKGELNGIAPGGDESDAARFVRQEYAGDVRDQSVIPVDDAMVAVALDERDGNIADLITPDVTADEAHAILQAAGITCVGLYEACSEEEDAGELELHEETATQEETES